MKKVIKSIIAVICCLAILAPLVGCSGSYYSNSRSSSQSKSKTGLQVGKAVTLDSGLTVGCSKFVEDWDTNTVVADIYYKNDTSNTQNYSYKDWCVLSNDKYYCANEKTGTSYWLGSGTLKPGEELTRAVQFNFSKVNEVYYISDSDKASWVYDSYR